MRARQKIPQANEFTMILVFHVDHPPAVLPPAHGAPVDDDGFLGADDGEGDQVFDAFGEGTLLVVVLVAVVGEHAQVVEGEFFFDALFEGLALFQGEGVGFCDYRDDVNDVGELF